MINIGWVKLSACEIFQNTGQTPDQTKTKHNDQHTSILTLLFNPRELETTTTCTHRN